ncbi:MAG: sigma-70 family RNA polymerase sigma factor [Candidatus Gracilibacteria bacterium]|nr:sigma-70 family RNA polymerase sigma factor [Candidatus Gracilibacteria bacterium]
MNIKQSQIDKLIRDTQNGNADAFGEVYDIYFQQIYKYVYYKVSEQHVEDLVSSIFIKTWTNISKYKKSKFPFKAWLFRIAHNAVIDHYRTNKAYYELEDRYADESSQIDPKHLLEKTLTGERIHRALGHLEKKYHEVVVLKFLNGLSNREIANVLGSNEGNVRTLQFRALKKMRVILEDEEQAAEDIFLQKKSKKSEKSFLKRIFAG